MSNLEWTTAQWVERWQRAGFPTLPIPFGTKKAKVEAWQMLEPATMWHDLAGEWNIGVRCGNGLAVADGDSQESVETLERFFDGLKAPVVIVKTWSGKRHFYLRVKDLPKEFPNYHKLASDIGKGEFRAGSGAYVLAPQSFVDDGGQHGFYRFAHGYEGPETIADLRPIRWRDLSKLVDGAPKCHPVVNTLPVGLLRRDPPARAALLFDRLAYASKGMPVEKYKSRSEAEAAIVCALIGAGWTFADIAREFSLRMPGHFADRKHGRLGELQRTYNRIVAYMCDTPDRQKIAQYFNGVDLQAWPGRGGALDKLTYQGLLSIAWQVDSPEVCASVRDLAEMTGASRKGVQNALQRLRQLGAIRKAGHSKEFDTARYIIEGVSISSHNSHGVPGGERDRGSQERGKVAQDVAVWGEFWRIFGRSAELVYGILASDQVLTAREISKRTGKCLNTVKNALKKLAGLDLAQRSGDGWLLGGASLAAVIERYDVAGDVARRHARHEQERIKYAELKRQRAARTSGG